MSTIGDEADAAWKAYQLLGKAFLLLDDAERQFFASYGLNARQFWALQHLNDGQGCSMIDLSRLLLTDKSSVTTIVDRLEHLQLVRRTPDTHDRRIMLITLTEEGLRLRTRMNEQHIALIRELLMIRQCSDPESFLNCLQAINRNIEMRLKHVRVSDIHSI
jgi:DNA-binding MarR family transcriptional regulator